MAKPNVGDLVTVKGYGGWAEVVSVTQDGWVYHRNRPPIPKWLCSVHFGPNNPQVGRAHTPNGKAGRTLKYPQSALHEFYSGKLTPLEETDPNHPAIEAKQEEFKAQLQTMSQEELIAQAMAMINNLQGA